MDSETCGTMNIYEIRGIITFLFWVDFPDVVHCNSIISQVVCRQETIKFGESQLSLETWMKGTKQMISF